MPRKSSVTPADEPKATPSLRFRRFEPRRVAPSDFPCPQPRLDSGRIRDASVRSRTLGEPIDGTVSRDGHDDTRHDIRRRSSSRGRPGWSAATRSRKPSAAGHRVRALVAVDQRHRAGSTSGASRRSPGDLEDAEALRRGVAGADWVFNCAAKVGDWGTLEEFRRLNVEALRLLLDAATEPRVERFVHVSSLGVYEGRDHYGTDETVPPPPSSLDAYTRSKAEAEALVLELLARSAGLPAAVVRPGFIYGARDRTVLPKLLDDLRRGTVRLLRLGRAGAQLHLRQEPGPRHLPGRRDPGGRRRGLQPDRRRARHQDAVRRPGGRAGGPAGPRAAHPALAGQSWPSSSRASPGSEAPRTPRWSTRPATSSSA